MLSEFKVSNFLSFDDEQVFSMEAGKVRSNINRVYTDNGYKLLKFMAVYGANASGKSNSNKDTHPSNICVKLVASFKDTSSKCISLN